MTATQAPTPGPLTSESVKLLVKGDLCITPDGVKAFDHSTHWDNIFVLWFADHEPFEPDVCAFIGRPDADGWMPWSGGENPVPGRRVELRLKSGITSGVYASEEIDWSCPCRFRLAPTDPLASTGSEDMRRREITAVMTALDSFHVLSGRVTATQAEHVLASLDALRPQPSGPCIRTCCPIRRGLPRFGRRAWSTQSATTSTGECGLYSWR